MALSIGDRIFSAPLAALQAFGVDVRPVLPDPFGEIASYGYQQDGLHYHPRVHFERLIQQQGFTNQRRIGSSRSRHGNSKNAQGRY